MKLFVAFPLLASLASLALAAPAARPAPAKVTQVVYVTASNTEVVVQTVSQTTTATEATDTSATTSTASTETTDSGDYEIGVVVSQYVEISGTVTHSYATTYTTTYRESGSESTAVETTATSTSTSSTSTSSATTTAQATTVLTATSSTSTTEATTATSSTSTATASSTSTDFKDAILNQHNEKRVLHGVVDLVWNETLEEYAQAYADKYDCSGTLTHSGGSYGENLGLGYTTTGVVDAWYDEISEYSSSDPVASHYTQVVWKATTEVGCAKKYCDSYWGQYTICSYYTAGNVIGYFSENVLPLVS